MMYSDDRHYCDMRTKPYCVNLKRNYKRGSDVFCVVFFIKKYFSIFKRYFNAILLCWALHLFTIVKAVHNNWTCMSGS